MAHEESYCDLGDFAELEAVSQLLQRVCIGVLWDPYRRAPGLDMGSFDHGS